MDEKQTFKNTENLDINILNYLWMQISESVIYLYFFTVHAFVCCFGGSCQRDFLRQKIFKSRRELQNSNGSLALIKAARLKNFTAWDLTWQGSSDKKIKNSKLYSSIRLAITY